jgi:hypothetical protein
VETACTVAETAEEIFAGAVYRPEEETVPVAAVPPAVPFTFHVTDPLWPPLTVAVNCWVAPGFSVADIGLTFTETGFEEPQQEESPNTRKIRTQICKYRIAGIRVTLNGFRAARCRKGGL